MHLQNVERDPACQEEQRSNPFFPILQRLTKVFIQAHVNLSCVGARPLHVVGLTVDMMARL